MNKTRAALTCARQPRSLVSVISPKNGQIALTCARQTRLTCERTIYISMGSAERQCAARRVASQIANASGRRRTALGYCPNIGNSTLPKNFGPTPFREDVPIGASRSDAGLLIEDCQALLEGDPDEVWAWLLNGGHGFDRPLPLPMERTA